VARTWACVLLALALPAAGGWREDLEAWRERREATLKADGGWLALAGLLWLREGANPVPGAPVVFHMRNGRITATAGGATRELRPDADDTLTAGRLKFEAIRRGDRFGVRWRDPESPIRRNFRGVRWFPPDPAYRVTARFAASPRKLPVANILGQIELRDSPGYVEFTLAGRTLRLHPTADSGAGQLFFVFRDQTSGRETYGGGRFLYADMPRNGAVTLDFNQAYNPPCAFTPYTTCPVPPKENRLPVRIAAGERAYEP
jgi:uncharacterized protein